MTMKKKGKIFFISIKEMWLRLSEKKDNGVRDILKMENKDGSLLIMWKLCKCNCNYGCDNDIDKTEAITFFLHSK